MAKGFLLKQKQKFRGYIAIALPTKRLSSISSTVSGNCFNFDMKCLIVIFPKVNNSLFSQELHMTFISQK